MRCRRSTSTASASRKMLDLAVGARPRRLVHAARADDQDAVRSQVHGRRDRRGLTHRAVAEMLDAALDGQGHGRKDEGNRRRGHQVRHADVGTHGDALRASPGQDVLDGIVEGHVQAGAVTGRRDGQRLQMAFAHRLLDRRRAHHALQQVGRRCVVQQRARPRAPPARDQPAHGEQRQPARAGADHAQRVGAVDLVGVEVLPHLGQHAHRLVEVRAAAGQRRRVDRAGRGAGDDGKRVAGRRVRLATDLHHRLEHADLVSGSGTAAGQHEPGGRRISHS